MSLRTYRYRHISLLGLIGLLSCGNPPVGPTMTGTGLNPDEVPLKVSKRCPGDAGCEATGDGKLYVGVAKQDITPVVEPFTDTNMNGVWDAGEPYQDRNGNGMFDPYWIAGYDNGRLAYDVHDSIWARALALRQNKTTLVVVAIDAIGYFHDETAEVQKLLDPKVSAGISLLLIMSTHSHQNADLMGGWGQTQTQNGINPYYLDQVRHGIAAAATGALANLQQARVTFGSVAVEDPGHDMSHYVSDSRDPVVIDNVLHTMQFSQPAPPYTPIATLINWAEHPDCVGSSNHSISSDWVGFLRDRVEQRGGGTVVYISGALGGQIGAGHVTARADDGTLFPNNGFAKGEAIGDSVARFALAAMADPSATTMAPSEVNLSLRTTDFAARVDNQAFHFALMLGVYKRAVCCYDAKKAISDTNVPSIMTQAAYIQLGPASIITNPGELLPELFIGGYQGQYAGTYKFIDFTKPNAPDVSKAPQPPYLIEVMDGPRAHRQTWGLAGDEVGYIVPRYNFVLAPMNPYLSEATGDHYEETNSIGPLAEPQIVGTLRQLVLDGRPNTPR